MSKPWLTERDWSEIYYAILDKRQSPSIQGEPEWKGHLDHILDVIGPDGKNMADDDE